MSSRLATVSEADWGRWGLSMDWVLLWSKGSLGVRYFFLWILENSKVSLKHIISKKTVITKGGSSLMIFYNCYMTLGKAVFPVNFAAGFICVCPPKSD